VGIARAGRAVRVGQTLMHQLATREIRTYVAMVSAILLFDGVCNLCSASVRFVIAHDRRNHFRFASLQSGAGIEVMRAHGIAIPDGDPSTMILVEGDRVYDRSSAAIRIARSLGFPWSLAVIGFVVPRFVRDAIYGVIARNRYRWFGKKDVCMVPTPELRARFL
jgi:predicted DCC family thiol-disulfide oxidoreductase YuxK